MHDAEKMKCLDLIRLAGEDGVITASGVGVTPLLVHRKGFGQFRVHEVRSLSGVECSSSKAGGSARMERLWSSS
jgi:hypothetical protein